MNHFFEAESSDHQVTVDALEAEIIQHEHTAIAAVDAISKLSDKHPDKRLVIGGALRKVSTIAGSRAQSVALQVTIKRKVTTL